MINIEEIKIKVEDKTSEHVLYTVEGSKQLVVFFPGGSSDATGPIFYFQLDYFLRNNYDVLTLSYNNLFNSNDPIEVKHQKIASNVYEAITYNKDKKTYDSYIFASRSFGNVVSNMIRSQYDLNISKNIYIAPIPAAFPVMKKHPGLIINGSKDEYLKEENYKELKTFTDHEFLVFEGADHMLEVDDTLETIDFHKVAIKKIIDFVHE